MERVFCKNDEGEKNPGEVHSLFFFHRPRMERGQAEPSEGIQKDNNTWTQITIVHDDRFPHH